MLYFEHKATNYLETLAITTDSNGSFNHEYTIPYGKQTGMWLFYGQEMPTDIRSPINEYTISASQPTINPQVSSTSGSRSKPDTLSQPGWGFSPYGIAELHFIRPDGTPSQITTENVGSDGRFNHNWTITSGAPIGTYQYWAIDLKTNIPSAKVFYQIYP